MSEETGHPMESNRGAVDRSATRTAAGCPDQIKRDRPVHAGHLVARYVVEPPIAIRWDTVPRRVRRREVDSSHPAEIRDVSLFGALIATCGHVDAEVGAIVQIRRGDRAGVVRVCHIRTDSRGTTLVGVEFVDISDALPDLSDIVGQVPGARQRLEQIWDEAE